MMVAPGWSSHDARPRRARPRCHQSNVDAIALRAIRVREITS
jgi:hypothetical protein